MMGIYKLLKEDMVTSLGCTEPAAVALAGAKAREILGVMPEKILIKCSQNIVKNVQGVAVPKAGVMKGISVACILGCIAGKSAYGLEVLKDVKKSDLPILKRALKNKICQVSQLNSGDNLHIICFVQSGNHTAEVEIIHSHDNIISVKKDGRFIFRKRGVSKVNRNNLDKIKLTFDDIYCFANTFEIEKLQHLLAMEIKYNDAIAKEGLQHSYGAQVGKVILEKAKGHAKEKIKAYAAAGSDARMSGCSMPVVISSGSGNQGLLILSTVYRYSKYLGVSKEILYRALVLANLLGIWQKFYMGKLSAFCGAVNAAAAAGAAITYMRGGTKKQIANTVINVLASAGGMWCDGAKPSCALKIAIAVDCAIIASDMAMSNNTFRSGDGIVKEGLEKTMASISHVVRTGMRQTDKKILQVMLGELE